MSSTEGENTINWRQKAILVSIAGFVVSIFTNLLIGLLLEIGFIPVNEMRNMGKDFGMQMYVQLKPYITKHKIGGPSFIFIDIDANLCEEFNDKDNINCKAKNLINGDLGSKLIKWADGSGAKLIIFDNAGNLNNSENKLITATAANTHATVIAPISGRVEINNEGPIRYRNPADDVMPQTALGNFRLASFSAYSDDKYQDGKLRKVIYEERYFDAFDMQTIKKIPTVFYYAASIFDGSDNGKVDCYYYYQNCTNASKITQRSYDKNNNELLNLRKAQPIGFSIKSLVHQNSDNVTDEMEGSEIVYTRLVGSDLFKADPSLTQFRPDLASGKIVIIGSSAQTGYDNVMTPIGPMAGPEVLINAIRSVYFRIHINHENENDKNKVSEFATIFLSSLKGTFIMAFAWFGIFYIAQIKDKRNIIEEMLLAISVTIIFLLFTAIVLCLEIITLSHEAGSGIYNGDFVDTLTPLILLGSEGYIEAMKWIVEKVEKALICVSHFIIYLFGLFRNVINKISIGG
jgi:CHASE2 domain